MDDIQRAVVGGESDTSLPCLFVRAGVLLAGQLVEEDLTGLLKANAVLLDASGRFVAVPDKDLSIQRREHVHIAIVYMRGWKNLLYSFFNIVGFTDYRT